MKNYLVMAGIALAVFLVGISFVRPVQQVVEKVTNTNLGAVSNPDLNSPYFSYGGVRRWAGHTESLTQASTTICSFLSPAGTSTLEYASVRLSVSSSTATTLRMAKATNNNASTTVLVAAAVAAGAQGTLVASTTASSGASLDGTNIFAPSTYLNVSLQGGIGTFSPTGVCNVIWTEV